MPYCTYHINMGDHRYVNVCVL